MKALVGNSRAGTPPTHSLVDLQSAGLPDADASITSSVCVSSSLLVGEAGLLAASFLAGKQADEDELPDPVTSIQDLSAAVCEPVGPLGVGHSGWEEHSPQPASHVAAVAQPDEPRVQGKLVFEDSDEETSEESEGADSATSSSSSLSLPGYEDACYGSDHNQPPVLPRMLPNAFAASFSQAEPLTGTVGKGGGGSSALDQQNLGETGEDSEEEEVELFARPVRATESIGRQGDSLSRGQGQTLPRGVGGRAGLGDESMSVSDETEEEEQDEDNDDHILDLFGMQRVASVISQPSGQQQQPPLSSLSLSTPSKPPLHPASIGATVSQPMSSGGSAPPLQPATSKPAPLTAAALSQLHQSAPPRTPERAIAAGLRSTASDAPSLPESATSGAGTPAYLPSSMTRRPPSGTKVRSQP